MSMLIMATALPSGRVGSFTHSAEPSRPSSSPANEANKMPRGSCPLSGANNRASSSTPAVPDALSSAPGMNLADLRRRERIVVPIAKMIVVRAEDHVFVGLAGQIRQHIVHGAARRFDVARRVFRCSV